MSRSRTYQVAYKIGASMASNFAKTMSGAKGALGELNKSMAEVGKQQQANQRVIELRKGLLTANKEFLAARERVAQLGAEMSRAGKPTQKMRREYEQAQRAVKVASDRLREQRSTLREVSAAAGATGKSTAQLVSEQKRLAEAGQRASKMQASLQKNIAAQQANVQKRSQYRGQLVGAMAGAAALAAPVKVAMDFEAAMSKVGAVARASDEELARLTKTARHLGATTAWSASQAAEGMTYLSMAGFSVGDTLETMPTMLALASSAGIELGTAADIASNMLSGFGLEVSDIARVSDVMVNTFTASNTTMEGLGETMKYVAPIAAQAGVSIENVAAMAGLLGDRAIQGGQAGTALRAVLNRLAGPPKMAAKSIKALGLQTKDAAGNLRDLPTLLAEVYEATKDMGSADRLAHFKAIAGQEAGAAFAILVDEAGTGELQRIAKAVEETGSTQRVASEMLDNTKGSWVQLKSAMEENAIIMGNILLPAVTEVFDVIAKGLLKVSEFAEKYPKLTTAIFGSVAAFTAFRVATIAGGYALTFVRGGLLTVRGILLAGRTAWLLYTGAITANSVTSKAAIVISKAMTAAQWLFNAAMAASPIGLVIVAIGALVAAGIWLYKNWDTVVEFFGWAWESIKGFFFDSVAWIKNQLAVLGNFVSSLDLFERGKELLMTLGRGILSVVGYPSKMVGKALKKVRDLLPFSDAKIGPLSELTASGASIMETLGHGVHRAASAPVDAVREGLGQVSGGLASFAERGASAPSGGLVVNVNQQITLEGAGEDAYEQARRGARDGAADMIQQLRRALAREERLSYG